MRIIAITSQKGGVGKTTTAINLGAALKRQGKRVLLLDLDPQGSLTLAMGRAAGSPSMAETLLDTSAIFQAIQVCDNGLHLVGSVPTLAVVLMQLAEQENPAGRLQQTLRQVEDRYDYALIDCPSSLGHAITNALTAAHVAIVPLQCEFLALGGMVDMQEVIEVIRETTNPGLQTRILGTMFTRRNLHAQDVLNEARAALPGLVYDTAIPRTVRLAEAPATGQTIFDYAPRTTGAEAYSQLAQELLQEETRHEQTRRYSSGYAESAMLYAA